MQVGPDGSKTKGDFYIMKPGKVRFEYDPPTPIAIIADGSSLAVRDRKLATQDIYPLSQTPLRFLLSDRIDLLKDTNVVSVTADDVFISVTIEEKQALIGTSRLMLMIGTKDGQLKQWTVTDPQGYDTTVAVYNLDANKKVDPGLFKIDFTNYSTPANWFTSFHPPLEGEDRFAFHANRGGVTASPRMLRWLKVTASPPATEHARIVCHPAPPCATRASTRPLEGRVKIHCGQTACRRGQP